MTGPKSILLSLSAAAALAAALPGTLCPMPAVAAGIPPAVDGLFDDWNGAEPVWTDPAGDGSRIDLRRVWVRSDRERVTFCFETGVEMSLQGNNDLTLFIDGDGDMTTGRAVDGMGVDMSWTFGERKGTLWSGDGRKRVEQAAVGLLQAPTVSSSRFEVSFLRWSADEGALLPGPNMAFMIKDEYSDLGDRLPDDGSVRFGLSQDEPPAGGDVVLERRHPDDIRVLTYNVLFDGLFKRPAAFLRILRALDPDVICFQEIWSHTARQSADQVSLAIPEVTWYGASTTEGQVVSRYPFVDERAIDEAGNYWALIDLPDDLYTVDLSIVSAHPPCCDKEKERQEQLDGIAAWLRDITAGGASQAPAGEASGEPGPDGSPLSPPPMLRTGTPIIVAGDMNLVGGAAQVRTLVAGEIVYVDVYGPPHAPDWDGTPLTDSNPRLAGGVDNFTWRDARSSFAPGKLDYIVYSDSVLEPGNAFTLATESLPANVLAKYGLRPGDTLEASDHLPVVADFTPLASPVRTGTGE